MAELEQQLGEVQRRFQDEIAPLEEEVLRLQVEQRRRAAQRHMRSARHRNAYHDAQEAYEEFQASQPPSVSVSTDEMKALYRRACKRCHPDVVIDTFKTAASGTFQALEAAYDRGQARVVQTIADTLDRWGFPGSSQDPETQEERTTDEAHLRRAVARLEDRIEERESTDLYRVLREAGGDIDALVQARKQHIREVLREIEER